MWTQNFYHSARIHVSGITLKNTAHRACHDVTVLNCRLQTEKSGFKFGSESYDGFYNVTVQNQEVIGGRDAIALLTVNGALFTITSTLTKR